MGLSPDAPWVKEAVARGLIDPADLPPPAGKEPAPRKGKAAGKRRRRHAREFVEPLSMTLPGGGLAFQVPVELPVVANGGAVKAHLIGLAHGHRLAVGRLLATRLDRLAPFAWAAQAGRPVRCRIVRLGVRECDDDGLALTAKWCRDTVALFLGVDDKPGGPVRWEYAQDAVGRWGVVIELRHGGA